LTAKPWLEVGAIDDLPGHGASSLPAATSMGVFLAVVSSLFAALHQRLFHANAGGGLGANARAGGAVVQHGCAYLEQCRAAIRTGCGTQGTDGRRGYGLIAGGLFALTFLGRAALCVATANAAGYYLAANPANAFFYLFDRRARTALVGGLVALALTATRCGEALR